MECPICFFRYSQPSRPPLILPCAHTFCKQCVKYLLIHGEGHLSCPTCRVGVSAKQVHPNFALQEVLEAMEKAEQRANFALQDVMDAMKKAEQRAAEGALLDAADITLGWSGPSSSPPKLLLMDGFTSSGPGCLVQHGFGECWIDRHYDLSLGDRVSVSFEVRLRHLSAGLILAWSHNLKGWKGQRSREGGDAFTVALCKRPQRPDTGNRRDHDVVWVRGCVFADQYHYHVLPFGTLTVGSWEAVRLDIWAQTVTELSGILPSTQKRKIVCVELTGFGVSQTYHISELEWKSRGLAMRGKLGFLGRHDFGAEIRGLSL